MKTYKNERFLIVLFYSYCSSGDRAAQLLIERFVLQSKCPVTLCRVDQSVNVRKNWGGKVLV